MKNLDREASFSSATLNVGNQRLIFQLSVDRFTIYQVFQSTIRATTVFSKHTTELKHKGNKPKMGISKTALQIYSLAVQKQKLVCFCWFFPFSFFPMHSFEVKILLAHQDSNMDSHYKWHWRSYLPDTTQFSQTKVSYMNRNYSSFIKSYATSSLFFYSILLI